MYTQNLFHLLEVWGQGILDFVNWPETITQIIVFALLILVLVIGSLVIVLKERGKQNSGLEKVHILCLSCELLRLGLTAPCKRIPVLDGSTGAKVS